MIRTSILGNEVLENRNGILFLLRKSKKWSAPIVILDNVSHIDVLLLTFFYNYMKPLIDAGMVYIAVPPLFRAVKGSQYKYLLDEESLGEYKKHNVNFELQRFKGCDRLI